MPYERSSIGRLDTLTKNSPTATLVGAIRKAATGGKYISPALAEQFALNVGGHPAVSHEALSDRELEVLKLLVSGESLAAIAKTLHLSPNTVTTYRVAHLPEVAPQEQCRVDALCARAGTAAVEAWWRLASAPYVSIATDAAND